MDEAEQLCDRLVVMDKAHIVAEGSPRALIERYATREVLELRFNDADRAGLDGQLAGLADRVEELPDRILLYTDDGDKFKAYNGRCTHLGCSYNYDHEKKTFLCPCHHGQFDPKTGAVLAGPPPRPLDELEVQVRDASVFVKYKDFRLGIPERIEA